MRNKYRACLGVIGFVIFLSSEGWGANWELLNQYDFSDGWSVKQYYDTRSIVKVNGGNIRVWIRQNDEKATKDSQEDMPLHKKLIEIDCSSREVKYFRIITVLKDGDYEEGIQKELDYLVPDSSKEGLYKVLCEKVNK